MDLSKLYQTQISLTEWFQRMGKGDSEAHRKEDNDKRERLAVLNDLIGLPFDRPTQFPASEIAERSPRFVEFLDSRGGELCALRLIPRDVALPKLRTRGASIRDSLEWFAQQQIDPAQYKADFVPHPSDHVWSTIFVVNHSGAFGQIIAGSHNQLTQGFFDEGNEPITFSWNGEVIETNPENADAAAHMLECFSMLRVTDPGVRQTIVDQFGAKFFGEYLCGYFETASSKQFGTWFIDWNRLLGDAYGDDATLPIHGEQEGLRGQVGSKGSVTGKARVIRAADLAGADIEDGDILVTDMTTPDFLPLMQKAGGVITQYGGILSHAAIVCRELGKPCVTNVKGLLDAVKDGDWVELDAENGRIRKM